VRFHAGSEILGRAYVKTAVRTAEDVDVVGP